MQQPHKRLGAKHLCGAPLLRPVFLAFFHTCCRSCMYCCGVMFCLISYIFVVLLRKIFFILFCCFEIITYICGENSVRRMPRIWSSGKLHSFRYFLFTCLLYSIDKKRIVILQTRDSFYFNQNISKST